MMNIVPSKWVNNFQRNSSMATPLLNDVGGSLKKKAKLKDITYLRNNIKYPLDFTIPAKDFIKQTNNPNASLLFENINAIKVPSKNVSNFTS